MITSKQLITTVSVIQTHIGNADDVPCVVTFRDADRVVRTMLLESVTYQYDPRSEEASTVRLIANNALGDC